jgi:D-alanyl-D-alanine carboxypeptidase (penicillin-binding protein 5/6)
MISKKKMIIKKYVFSVFISLVIILLIGLIIPQPDSDGKNQGQTYKKITAEKIAAVSPPRVTGRGLRILSKDPYSSAIVIDAATGTALFEENADARGYPASIVKLMDLLIILEAVKAEHITLQDKITISAEAARIGGSQVYLREKEVFTVDDLLYALIVKSANDAAVALALYYAGSKEYFVHLMNKRARELGMKDTVFHSVHGLPPGRGDIVKLCLELLMHPEALRYTSTKVRRFRTHAPEPFIMRNHNHLVGRFEGCDGFKTGFFWAAGYNIAATAVKNGERAIAVIFGSLYSKARDENARKLLSKGLMEITANLPTPAFAAKGITASRKE